MDHLGQHAVAKAGIVGKDCCFAPIRRVIEQAIVEFRKVVKRDGGKHVMSDVIVDAQRGDGKTLQ
jgi:hypothetical protein